MAEQYFSYALIKCADELRDELLNVGVVVVNSSGEVRIRVIDSVSRINRVLPNVPHRHLKNILDSSARRLEDTLRDLGLKGLFSVGESWNGTVRISNVRSILAKDISAVTGKLFERYVAEPKMMQSSRTAGDGGGETFTSFTSRRVVRSIETRLARNDLREGQHYRRDANIDGLTKARTTVPVYYPIEVYGYIYIDGIEVRDEQRTINVARAMAQKAAETFRAQEAASITVAVRDPEASKIGVIVDEIIQGDGSMNGSIPEVLRYAAPDQMNSRLADLLQPQQELLSS